MTAPAAEAPRSDWARYYTERGFGLVPLTPGTKETTRSGWNRPGGYLTAPDKAEAHYRDHPHDNMGALHVASRTAALDLDHPAAAAVLALVGVDLAKLQAEAGAVSVGSTERPPKLWYRTPEGLDLSLRKLAWPNPEPGRAPVCILELRSGAVQDVLPPSTHPDGHAYRWARLDRLDPLPPELLDLWQRWDELAPVMGNACPWASEPAPAPVAGDWAGVRAEVLRRYSLADALAEAGVEMGRGSKARCPFHADERHASFWTWTADGVERWCCAHGGAPVGHATASGYSTGDALDLFAWHRGLTLGRATVELAGRFGVPVPGGEAPATGAPPSGARQGARPGDPWPADALPLHRDLPPPERFPVEALGAVLGGMAETTHAVVRSPLATCGQAVLAAAAVAAQAHVDVEVDGRRSPVSCFFVTVSGSGERKSGTDRVALAPHRRRQEMLAEAHGPAMEFYRADVEGWKTARAEALKKAKGREAKRAALLDLGPEPQPPPSPILLCSEPSLEGLKKALAIGQPSMGLYSDEGAQFVNGFSMADDRRLGTLGGFSKLWDGDPLDRVRGGDGASLLFGRRVSSHLMLQPVAAERLLGDPLAAGQGYLARCLVTWPESALGSMLYVEGSLSATPEARRYFARLMSLLETEPATAEGDPRELRPRGLTLEPDAKATWVAFHDWVQRLLSADGPLRPVKAFAAKAAEHALRLSGVLAVVEDLGRGTLALRHVEAGLVLARFYLEEALRLRAVGDTAPDLVAASTLLAWLTSRPSRVVPIREVYQFGPGSLRDRATAARLLGILAEHGWVRPVGSQEIEGTKHREVWEVRP